MGRHTDAPRWARTAGAAAALTLLLVPTTAATGPSTRDLGTGRAATTNLAPIVREEMAIVRPSGVAPQPDGVIYVSEEATASVFRIAPDGTRFRLPLDLEAPAGLELGDDGTLYIADGSRISVLAPDGTLGTIPVDGAVLLGWVGIDAAGSLYALDRGEAAPIVRIDPDGTQEALTITGDRLLSGLGVADDGTVTVLDAETGEAIRRAPDGTETVIPIAGAEGGQSIDDDGDRIVVGGTASVLQREADGTVTEIIQQGLAVQVRLEDEGSVWSAATGITGCRCPEDPGTVHRRPAGGTDERIPLGDLADFGSVAADGQRTVLYTSFSGPRGYADLNPLRRSIAVGTSEDLPVDDATTVDAAADGTQVLQLDRFGAGSLARRTSDGAITEVALPTEPGIDVVTSFAVDQDGTIAAVLGSGYGTGAYKVVTVAPDGTTAERYRSEGTPAFLAVGMGGGRLVILVLEGSEGTILELPAGAAPKAVASLPATTSALEVDAAGNVWAIGYPTTGPQLDVLRTDGSTDTFTYDRITSPTDLSAWTDGTLYVADATVGVLSLGQIAGVAAPSGPPPAVPVPGNANFTG